MKLYSTGRRWTDNREYRDTPARQTRPSGRACRFCVSGSRAIPPTIPTTEPTTLASGTTWQWTKSLSDFPASAGLARVSLAGATSLSFAATATGDVYAVTVPAAVTEDVTAGTYQWLARLTLGGVVYDADSGTLVVTPNIAVDAASDQRTHAERMLAAIEAELQARIDGTGSAHDAYSIALGVRSRSSRSPR